MFKEEVKIKIQGEKITIIGYAACIFLLAGTEVSEEVLTEVSTIHKITI